MNQEPKLYEAAHPLNDDDLIRRDHVLNGVRLIHAYRGDVRVARIALARVRQRRNEPGISPLDVAEVAEFQSQINVQY